MYMVNITVSIPQELCDKMKRYSEVKWSEVVRKALVDYVGRMEKVEGGVVPSEKLAAMLKDSNLDVSNVNLERAVEYYEEGRKLERKRLSTTQTSS
jgi:metal-responsive CopG/Arc/MetJ family transcriptional regulator